MGYKPLTLGPPYPAQYCRPPYHKQGSKDSSWTPGAAGVGRCCQDSSIPICNVWTWAGELPTRAKMELPWFYAVGRALSALLNQAQPQHHVLRAVCGVVSGLWSRGGGGRLRTGALA